MNFIREGYQKKQLFCLVNFEDVASKLEKNGQFFHVSIHFGPSLPSVATDDRKQFQCRKIVFNNKTRPLFLELN